MICILCEQEKCDEFAHEVMRLVPQEGDREHLIDMLVGGPVVSCCSVLSCAALCCTIVFLFMQHSICDLYIVFVMARTLYPRSTSTWLSRQ